MASTTIQKTTTNHAFAWIVLLVFSVLALAGLQRLVAALLLVPVHSTISALEAQESVSDEDLDALIRAERRVLAVRDRPRDWSNIGMALALKAIPLSADDPQRLQLLEEAIDALQHSLAQAPSMPNVWLRLANVEAGAMGHADLALRYFDLSLMTGPNEPQLYTSRITLGIALWPYLVSSERLELFAQMRQAWHYDRWPFINLVVSLKATNIARAALATDIKDLLEFDKMAPKPTDPPRENAHG